MKRSRIIRLAFGAGVGLLVLSACGSSPETVSPETAASVGSSGATSAESAAQVSCVDFNMAPSLEGAYAAMSSVTGRTYTEANGHSLLQGAQTACSIHATRTLNEVMVELTEGQVAATPTGGTEASTASPATDPVTEACSLSSKEPYYTVEILSDFPAVWKSDAPLPQTGGRAVCHELAPGSAQLHRYWVYFRDEQAGQAPALAWDDALRSAGFTKTCREGDVTSALQGFSAGCEYISASGQPAAIDYDRGFGWQLWFLPKN